MIWVNITGIHAFVSFLTCSSVCWNIFPSVIRRKSFPFKNLLLWDASLVISFLIVLAINNKVTASTSLLIICDENTVTGRWFPSLGASNVETGLMLWRHAVLPGVGMAAVYVSSQVAVCGQFSPTRTALATLFISFSGNIGVIIFISCYQCFFYSDGKPANQNIGGYFLTLAVANIVLHGLLCGVQCAQALSPEDTYSQVTFKNVLPGEKCNRNAINPSSVWNVLTSCEYHVILWPNCVAMALRIGCISNLDVFSTSLDINQYHEILFYIYPIVSVIIKVLFGISLMIYTEERVPQAGMIVISNLCLVTGFLLANFWLNNIWMLILIVALWTVGGGFTSVVPSLLVQIYGSEFSAIAVSSTFVVFSAILYVLQYIFGRLYDKNTIDIRDRICHGYECFTEIFEISVAVSSVCAIIFTIYVCLKKSRLPSSK